MFAVIFEVEPKADGKDAYLDIAASLRPELEKADGFISIERFQSLTNEDKLLSISYWRDEASLVAWRNVENHQSAQATGRTKLFNDYRIRIAEVVRDYTLENREQAPQDPPEDK